MSSTRIRREVGSIARNSGVYMAGTVLSRLVGFVMLPVYTRLINPAGYGSLEMIDIVTSMVALIVAMGVAESLARFYFAEDTEVGRRLVVSTFFLGFAAIGIPIVLGFAVVFGMWGSVFLDSPQSCILIQMSLAGVWFGLLSQIAMAYLRARYMARTFVAVSIGGLVLALSMNIWFVVVQDLQVLGVVLATLVSQAIVGSILTVAILTHVGLRFSLPLFLQMLSFGLPLIPAQIGSFLGFISNRLALRWLGPADPAVALAQIGIFSLGHKFGVVINRFVNSPFNAYWGPRRLELLNAEQEAAKPTLARICTYSAFATTFLAVLLCAGLENVLQVIADPDYLGAHTITPFVALSYVLLGLEPHLATALVFRGKTKHLATIGMLSLLVAVAWNVLLVPRFGLYAAATANLVAVGFRQVCIYHVSQRVWPIPFEIRRLVILVSVGCAWYFVATSFSMVSPYATFAVREFIACLFPLALLGIRFYHPEEIRFVGRFVRSPIACVKSSPVSVPSE